MEGEKMAYSDKIYKKEKLISRTFYIDEKLYLELERLSKEVYEASINKLINIKLFFTYVSFNIKLLLFNQIIIWSFTQFYISTNT